MAQALLKIGLIALLALLYVESYRKQISPFKRIWKLSVSPTRSPLSPQKEKSRTAYQDSDVWKSLTTTAKEQVKKYFIQRATRGGIPWKEYHDLGASNMDILLQNYMDIAEPSIVYPEYYTQAFHSYSEGNLNWEAALEAAAATISISASYWPLATVANAQSWMRGNTTNAIRNHIQDYEASTPSTFQNTGKIMDIGCSIGASTKFLIEAFPEKEVIDAVDLSPYFLSAAKFYHSKLGSPMFTEFSKKIAYHHMMAETLSFPSDSYDVVSISYLLHEVPTEIAKKVLNQAFRVLRPGGTLSIVDLSGSRIKNLPQIRRHFFELTEPHVREYYKTDIMKILADHGFTMIETKGNDPMNQLWLASKPGTVPMTNFIADIQEHEVSSSALTSLGRRLSEGSIRLKSTISTIQNPQTDITPLSPSYTLSITKPESIYRSLLNFFTDEKLWAVIRFGFISYFVILLLSDMFKFL